jgi:hypothetical protein
MAFSASMLLSTTWCAVLFSWALFLIMSRLRSASLKA